MDLERRVGVCLEWLVEMVDPPVEQPEQLSQLRDHLGVGPDEVDRVLERHVLRQGLVGERRDKHVQEAPRPLRQGLDPWTLACQQSSVGGDAIGVIDVEEPADGPAEDTLLGSGG